MLQLQILKHVRLLQVCLVEVQKLATDQTIVLRHVLHQLLFLLDFALQLVLAPRELLLHHLEVRDLLVKLHQLLSFLSLLFLLFDNLLKFIDFLLRKGKFWLELPR